MAGIDDLAPARVNTVSLYLEAQRASDQAHGPAARSSECREESKKMP